MAETDPGRSVPLPLIVIHSTKWWSFKFNDLIFVCHHHSPLFPKCTSTHLGTKCIIMQGIGPTRYIRVIPCQPNNFCKSSQVSVSNIAHNIPKITLISIMKPCQIQGCNSEYFWRYSLSNFRYCVFALATKMLTFEVSYLHFLPRQRSQTCYTD